MKALVIGGTGPTGPFVVEGLLERGYQTTILHTGRHEVERITARVEHIHTDPFDARATADALGDRSFDIAIVMYGRLRDLAPLLAGRCGRFISVGGVPVYRGYGRPTSIFPHGLPVPTREDAPKAGAEEVSKVVRIVETEELVFSLHPRATHLRYPLIYGPGQLLPREWLIVRRALDRRPHIILPDAGLTLRTAAYGENAAHALLLAVDRPEASSGKAYNVSDETVLTLRQVVEVIADALGHRWEIVSLPLDLAPHTLSLLMTSWSFHRVTDVAALRYELGYRDRVPAIEAIARTARWLAEHRPQPGGREERGLQDPFDYAWEDRLVAAWQAATEAVGVVAKDGAQHYRDRYAQGPPGVEAAIPPGK